MRYKSAYLLPHIITLAGLSFAVLALIELFNGSIDSAVRYSLLVLFVDRIDGTLARALKVNQRYPEISGTVLDMVTDLIGLTFVPMFIFWKSGLFLPGTGELLVIASVVTASYKYSRKEANLINGYSLGAPPIFFSIFLFYFLDLPLVCSTLYTAGLILLALSPIKYPITSLVTTHWKPGFKSITNYLTAIFFIPVFVMLGDAPAFIYWVMLIAIILQLTVYPLLLQANVIKPVFDRNS